MLKVIIVDDEPIARQVLREELELLENVTVVAEAENGLAALKQILVLKPDLVFLDLEMPLMTGFEVVENLKGEEAVPVVIIVTAYDQHAIAAFEAGAVDYLLKPVRAERLRKAVERASALRGRAQELKDAFVRVGAAIEQSSKAKIGKIAGRTADEYFILDLQEILAFQAEGELVWIITSKQRYLATQRLKEIESRLAGGHFQRVRRNAIVNINHVRKISPLSSQRWLMTLSNGQEFVVSKRQAHTVRHMMRW